MSERDTPIKFIKRNLSPARIASLAKRGYFSLKSEGLEATWRKVDFRLRLMTGRDVWKFRADIPLKKELRLHRREIFPFMPLVSIVVPLYNTPEKFFDEMLRSVLSQTYSNWQLVLADASDRGQDYIEKKLAKHSDDRIVYIKLGENRGISGNTNRGFERATGDFIALLDHDDCLSPDALYENVKAINRQGADMLYSDEITLSGDMKNLVQYHFKAGFAPDFLRGVNYITHFLVFSRDLAQRAGFYEDSTCDGAQDYDLILRLSEKAEKIVRIPKVLYYWRAGSGSTAEDMKNKDYAFRAGKRALEKHLGRLGLKGEVSIQKYPGSYRVKYPVEGDPLVSVIIPNCDHRQDLSRCVESLYKYGSWENTEVVIVENNSQEEETFILYETLKSKHAGLKVVTYEGPFNFSAVCNCGIKKSAGEHILLLNNDVELISDGFIPEMLSFSQRRDVGAVGAKLYYPDDTIQHAGVIMGINGSAGHSHKGIDRYSTGDMYRLVTTQNYLAVTGACLMTKREHFENFPLDEENFAIAYNDVDFCLRLYEAGFLNVFTPYSEAVHNEGKSRGTEGDENTNPRYEAEKKRFTEKWQKYFDWQDPYYNPHFTLQYENYGYK